VSTVKYSSGILHTAVRHVTNGLLQACFEQSGTRTIGCFIDLKSDRYTRYGSSELCGDKCTVFDTERRR